MINAIRFDLTKRHYIRTFSTNNERLKDCIIQRIVKIVQYLVDIYSSQKVSHKLN